MESIYDLDIKLRSISLRRETYLAGVIVDGPTSGEDSFGGNELLIFLN